MVHGVSSESRGTLVPLRSRAGKESVIRMFNEARPAARIPPMPAPARPRIGAIPAFLAGSAVGFVVAAVFTRPRRDPEAAAVRTLAGGWAQLAAAWQEMLDTWAVALERAPAEIDLDALSERLRALPGGESVTVRLLGNDIVELTGDLPAAEEHAQALLEAVAEEAGVNVVLNRIWFGGERERRPAPATRPRE